MPAKASDLSLSTGIPLKQNQWLIGRMRNKSILFGKPQSTLTSMVCLLVNGFIDQLLIARRQNRASRKFSTKTSITTNIISSHNFMRRIGNPEIISDNAESWRRKAMFRLVMETGMFLEITNCNVERSRQLRWYLMAEFFLIYRGAFIGCDMHAGIQLVGIPQQCICKATNSTKVRLFCNLP